VSGIAAIYDFAGAPVGRAELQPLLDAITDRGPVESAWCGDGVALGQRLLATTPEAGEERLPLDVAGGEIQVALDGRLDNRPELLEALGLQPGAASLTDPGLVALAYQRWREGCVERLIGDFAFVLWDGARRELLAARDQRGFRPLVYAFSGRRIVFGSEPAQLFAYEGIARTVDSLFLACHLTGAAAPPDATPYASVYQLPPGHYLTARGGDVAVHEYWRYGPRPVLRYKRLDEYVEHFETVFGQAVAAVTRTASTPAVLLSGGLDSSYVLARAKGSAPAVAAVHAFSERSEGMDERVYARAVAEHLDVALTEVDVGNCWSLSRRYLPDAAFDQPNLPMQGALLRRMNEAARDAGYTVLLDGQGGDELLDGSYDYLADLVLAGQVGTAISEARRWSADADIPASRLLASSGLAPLLPMSAREAFRRLRGRPTPNPTPPWIDEQVLRVAGLEVAIVRPYEAAAWQKGRAAERFWRFYQQEMLPVIAWKERFASLPLGVEMRSPFWDLRVIELTLRFPSWVNRAAGRPKEVLRRAMRPRLPAQISERRDKAVFNELLNRGIDEEQQRVEEALLGEPMRRLLYVRHAVLEKEIEVYLQRRHPWWYPLWRAISAGLWLNGEEARRVEHARSVLSV
jgi:asparagine synthase (glutamine-hydrolysing)